MIKIAIIGLGTLGVATAHLFRDFHKTLFDTVKWQPHDFKLTEEKHLRNFYLPIDKTLCVFTSHPNLLVNASIWFICVPTPINDMGLVLDTTVIDEYLQLAPEGTHIVIRSTVPLGYMDGTLEQYPHLKISYFPEFLREQKVLDDNMFPSRHVWGGELPHDNILTTIINRVGGLRVDKLPESFYHVSVKEAEYIKLYSNAYLSLRLTFFGELDKQCSLEKLNSARVIKAICHDPRIGDKYNSPPFKIAGKCLPKDLINLAIQTNNPLLQTVVHLMDK